MPEIAVLASGASDPIALREIATFAEQLEVPNRISTSPRERDDVVKAQALARGTLHTPSTVALPDLTLYQTGYRFAAWLDRFDLGHRCGIDNRGLVRSGVFHGRPSQRPSFRFGPGLDLG